MGIMTPVIVNMLLLVIAAPLILRHIKCFIPMGDALNMYLKTSPIIKWRFPWVYYSNNKWGMPQDAESR